MRYVVVAFVLLSGVLIWWLFFYLPSLQRSRHQERITLDQHFSEYGFERGDPVLLRGFKESSELELWVKRRNETSFSLMKTYRICAWSGSLGPKLQEGDRQTPEGFYSTNIAQLNPHSSFHLSFDIGFPNQYDRSLGRTGSHIMIHGACVSVGCLAMTDPGIEEIYQFVEAALRQGQTDVQIQLFPFRMDQARLKSVDANHKWLPFWKNLHTGDQLFQETRLPVRWTTSGGSYEFF